MAVKCPISQNIVSILIVFDALNIEVLFDCDIFLKLKDKAVTNNVCLRDCPVLLHDRLQKLLNLRSRDIARRKSTQVEIISLLLVDEVSIG